MISEHIKAAILALLEADANATETERESVVNALSGGRAKDRVLKFAEAAERTGLHENTIRALVRNGSLVGVRGRGSRNAGISERSLERLMFHGKQ